MLQATADAKELMYQTNATEENAIAALRRNDYEMVPAITELNQPLTQPNNSGVGGGAGAGVIVGTDRCRYNDHVQA
jgi:hypothetical protein